MDCIGIGERIRIVRGRATIPEFADKLSIHKSTLIRYEKEESYPDAKVILRMCSKLNINSSWLLTGEIPKEKIKISDSYVEAHAHLRKKLNTIIDSTSFEEIKIWCESIGLETDPEIVHAYIQRILVPSDSNLAELCDVAGYDNYDALCASAVIGFNRKRDRRVFDSALLMDVIQEVEEFLLHRNITLTIRRKSLLITWTYENIINNDAKLKNIDSEVLRILESIS